MSLYTASMLGMDLLAADDISAIFPVRPVPSFYGKEVLLKNVQLILEAFDYLQLPFTLNQGRIRRLSIKIPWKKLGLDPINISLENVFLRLSRRPCHQSLDVVQTREFVAKKA
ncbi:hypothetical protein ACFE04_031212 [Oxalis oulophora]